MKRRDLKKLALLGLTSGILLSTQGHVGAVTDFSSNANTTLASGHKYKCGNGSCGSRRASCGGLRASCGGLTAMRDAPVNDRLQRDSNMSPDARDVRPNAPVQRYPSAGNLTAEKLRDQLDVPTKRIYDALPEAGKQLALQTVNQDPTRNKNEIVTSIRDKLSEDNNLRVKSEK